MTDEAEGYYFIVAFLSMMFLSGWWAIIIAVASASVVFGMWSITTDDNGRRRPSWKW